jgi:hypothetical protein
MPQLVPAEAMFAGCRSAALLTTGRLSTVPATYSFAPKEWRG